MRDLHQTHPGGCDKGKFVLSLIWVCLNIGLPLATQESNRIHHHVHFQQWLFSVVYTPGIFRDRPWWTHIYLVTLHLRAIRGAVWLALKPNWLNNQQVGKMKHTHWGFMCHTGDFIWILTSDSGSVFFVTPQMNRSNPFYQSKNGVYSWTFGKAVRSYWSMSCLNITLADWGHDNHSGTFTARWHCCGKSYILRLNKTNLTWCWLTLCHLRIEHYKHVWPFSGFFWKNKVNWLMVEQASIH